MKRRQFMKRSVAAAAFFPVPLGAAHTSVAGANDRVCLGFVGVGGRAGSLMRGFAAFGDVNITSVCDVDSRRIPGAVKEVAERKNGTKPRVVRDFRTIMDDQQIDAVVVGTPDHWHALPTIHACRAGKDVYVEKPDAHNIKEGRLMVEAARKYKRVVQMGIQSRSGSHHAEANAYIRTGTLGKVSFVRAWESTRQRNLGFPPDGEAPPGVDYDTWLGPAPERPFNPLRFHGTWRWFFDYGTGDLGNDGVHRLDYAFRGLNAARESQGLPQVTYPLSIASSGGKRVFHDAQQWPDTLYVTFDYPGATMVYEMCTWAHYPFEGESEGAAIYGENGYVVIGNRRWRAFGRGGKPTGEGGSGNPSMSEKAHKRDFITCIHTRRQPVCSIEKGHVTSVLCHAGNIAWRTGKKLFFDSETHSFAGDPEANTYLTRSYRRKWSLPETI